MGCTYCQGSSRFAHEIELNNGLCIRFNRCIDPSCHAVSASLVAPDKGDNGADRIIENTTAPDFDQAEDYLRAEVDDSVLTAITPGRAVRLHRR